MLQRCEAPQHNVHNCNWITNVVGEGFAEVCWARITRKFGEATQVPIWFCNREANVFRRMVTCRWSHVGKLLERSYRVQRKLVPQRPESLFMNNPGAPSNGFNLPFMPKEDQS
jgi:hypothetical protein